jgi:K+-transporting ATPase KdpF subunit
MSFETGLAFLCSVGLLVYLIAALLRPEMFE